MDEDECERGLGGGMMFQRKTYLWETGTKHLSWDRKGIRGENERRDA